jgi:hypothetical protein
MSLNDTRLVRSLFLVWSFAVAALCSAQKPVELQYRLMFQGMNGGHGEKAVITAIKDQDPGARISASSEVQQVKVITTVQLDRDALSAALATHGIALLDVVTVRPEHNDTRSAIDAPGFPQYIDTGNEEADRANYRMRKQAWIEAHPEFVMPASGDR